MFTLTDLQKVHLAVVAKDKDGNVLDLKESLQWSSTDTSVVDLVPDDDGHGAYAVSGSAGSCTVKVVLPSNPDVLATLDFEVVAHEVLVASLEIVPGTPEDK